MANSSTPTKPAPPIHKNSDGHSPKSSNTYPPTVSRTTAASPPPSSSTWTTTNSSPTLVPQPSPMAPASQLVQPEGSPAMPQSSPKSSAADRYHWTSAPNPDYSARVNESPSHTETADAPSPTVKHPLDGATHTTSANGPKAYPPTWPTASCSAAATTACSTTPPGTSAPEPTTTPNPSHPTTSTTTANQCATTDGKPPEGKRPETQREDSARWYTCIRCATGLARIQTDRLTTWLSFWWFTTPLPLRCRR